MRRNLAGFTGANYDKGRGRLWQVAWLVLQSTAFQRWWFPARLRVVALRVFGATIGEDVLIRHRVRIHWPWKLTVGDASWIGEGVWILNLEPVTIGSDVCVSQDVLLCTGSHDRRSPTFEFDNGPIVVGDGSWLGLRSILLRGVTVGCDVVVGATVLITSDVADGSIVLSPRGDAVVHGNV